uniref:Potassium voltage-gated channel modifier subfamily F member 1 n=1 Tax=Paramormyrops kingsleyae TaxID=1676925 RepID=A0A3B3RL39_9TELE|nr:potassium voltage-gated channel subfamily F member 1-like [Paramormyrops kingsleyae]
MWATPKTRYSSCSGSEAIEDNEIVVNIGGVKRVLSGTVLNLFPDTRLAELGKYSSRSLEDLFALCDDYDPSNGEFYFDRDPDSFKCIVELYFYGEIHIKRGICPICFIKEMEFWKVDPDYLDECCKSHLSEVEQEQAEIRARVKLILDDMEGDSSISHWQRYRKSLWKLMEKPDSSKLARAVAIVSFLFTLLSTVVMCLGTISDLQVEDDEGNHVEHPTLDAIETACICWFTVEYLVRLVSSPKKASFILSFMNMVDLLAIVPFYVALVLMSLGTAVMRLGNVQQAVQALRIMRIVRIFKLARHSSGLKTLTYALKSSFSELGLLLMYLGVGIFVFSALGYTMEQSHPETMFHSIPQSFWWAIITMTTVGYGDIYPKTTLGRCSAAVSFLCGLIAIALPIHPIINNFVTFYNKQKILETATKHELELMVLQEGEGALPKALQKALKPSTVTGVSDNSMCDTYLPLLEDSAQKVHPLSCMGNSK